MDRVKLYYEDYNGKRYKFKTHKKLLKSFLKVQTA